MKELQKLIEYGKNYTEYKPIHDELKKLKNGWTSKRDKYEEATAPSLRYGTQRAAISMQICRKGQRPCLSLNGKKSTPLSAGREQRNIPS